MEKKRMIIVFLLIVLFAFAMILSIFSHSGKYCVRFETGTNDILLTKYVKKGGKISEPVKPFKNGYIFKEWQLDGKTYNFDSSISSNIILTAKWIKEEYVRVSFDTKTDDIIEPIKILKGETLENLPCISKENYTFQGWYKGDKPYNGEEIYDDIVLEARYEPNKTNSNYNIGDNVIITGEYSNAAYRVDYISTKAIGWERRILYIYEDALYPYMVGNDSGVIGFFSANSIEIKEEF